MIPGVQTLPNHSAATAQPTVARFISPPPTGVKPNCRLTREEHDQMLGREGGAMLKPYACTTKLGWKLVTNTSV